MVAKKLRKVFKKDSFSKRNLSARKRFSRNFFPLHLLMQKNAKFREKKLRNATEFLLSKMWNQNRCPLYNTIFCKHRYDFETQILPNNKQ